tara:strand:- start:92 stop:292 length:201 start_codon:yes stop_codon:yes gene_type:complete
MVLALINKILLLIFVLSIINTIKNILQLIIFWAVESGKYRISSRETFLLGLSLSFILASMISGIKI